MIKIINYWYSVNGIRLWFSDFEEALTSLRTNYKHIYENAMNPETYINMSIVELEV